MANGAILLQWQDRNWAEQGHYIYRSDTPMNPNDLPSPIGSVEQNITEYTDYDVQLGKTYYYRIAAYRNNDVIVSDEIGLIAEPRVVGPGPEELIIGDFNVGFFGEVSTDIMPNGSDLADQLSLTAGTAFNTDEPWLKFAHNGETLYIAKKPYRYNISWEDIYNVGAVYGLEEDVFVPNTGRVDQGKLIEIDGFMFELRLLKGMTSDPTSWTSGTTDPVEAQLSEWNQLIYKVHHSRPTLQAGGNMWDYSDSDLGINGGNGATTLTLNSLSSLPAQKIGRGGSGLSSTQEVAYDVRNSTYGWRPVLRLITDLIPPMNSSGTYFDERKLLVEPVDFNAYYMGDVNDLDN